MKSITFIFIIVVSFGSLHAQDDTIFGKHTACWDMCYFDCHTGLIFEFKNDSSYSFLYIDDVTTDKSEGSWTIKQDTIYFQPFKIPDSVKVFCYYDREVNNDNYQDFPKDPDKNVLWILKSEDERLSEIDVVVYQQEKSRHFKTDKFGHFKYDGTPADSIKFTISNKVINLKPNPRNNPSWVKAYITTTNKDIVIGLFGGKLEYVNGSLVFYYNCGDENNKKVIFKKDGKYPEIPARILFDK